MIKYTFIKILLTGSIQQYLIIQDGIMSLMVKQKEMFILVPDIMLNQNDSFKLIYFTLLLVLKELNLKYCHNN